MTDVWVPAPPYSWWSVEDAAVGMTGGIALYYRLGPRRPIRDERRRWQRDGQGRIALEAFGALPLQTMYQRLRDREEEWLSLAMATREAIVASDPERVPRRWLADLAELVAFVKTFGPIGFDWARTYRVENREADRARDELDRRRMADVLRASGGTGEYQPSVGRRREWQVVFLGPGFSRPNVREVRTYPDLSWAQRIARGDDVLPHDFLGAEPSGALWGHQDDLRGVLGLVNVLADGDPNPHDIREAAGALPGIAEYDIRDRSDRDPIDLRWSEAPRPPRPGGGQWWNPFREHPTKVDWPKTGRLMLAQFLSEQLAWTTIEAGLDAHGNIRTRWSPHSLLEVIYLQLLEHVEERLHFGIGWCSLCGGPILRTRLSLRTQNRAHRGCAAVIRKRNERARKRDGRTAEVAG